MGTVDMGTVDMGTVDMGTVDMGTFDMHMGTCPAVVQPDYCRNEYVWNNVTKLSEWE